MGNLFNCSEHKVIKIKAELESIGLLFQKQLGFNPKTKKNEPNRLYLSKLDVQATDVYLRGEYGQKDAQSLGTSGTAKNAVPHKTAESLGISGTAKNAVPHKTVDKDAQSLGTSGTAKNAVNLDLERSDRDKDRYLIDTPELDFSTANYSQAEIEQQNRDLIENAITFSPTQKLMTFS